jgi:hypothetical protein
MEISPKLRLLFFLLFTLVLTACSAASTSTPAQAAIATTIPPVTTKPIATLDRPPTTAVGAFFALSVADVEASAKWYSEKLDLKIIKRPPKANQATIIVLEGNGLMVELIPQAGAQSLSQVAPDIKNNILVHGLVKAGFIVEDFDKTVALLKERQVSMVIGPFPAKADQRANVIIKDNEGNLIQLFGK